MYKKIQIKKIYYSPIKSFNFVESSEVRIFKDLGIENDRIFAFVRNMSKENAIKFQNKQHLRNNQSYLSVKNTPILNNYQVKFLNSKLEIYFKGKKLISIPKIEFNELQNVVSFLKRKENILQNKEIYLLYNNKVPFYDMINDNVISLINLETLKDFEIKTGLSIDHQRFRANIIVDTIKPMEELKFINKNIMIGKVVFKVFSNIPRCKATNYPYKSDKQDLNFPQKLNEIYGHIDFGIYLKPISSGQINLNDTVSFEL